ncbi:hypothetical protein D9757_001344 [Collybiopsis confluens]|uniref:phosphoinositide 5-phosphatase n=1 Tax=Collybiopsis confluens TaxID=2823264 RepID=A0A8H5I116_9AGAR|nr:hypothetical protein D9757_001344 [Collybiopsis confluens]
MPTDEKFDLPEEKPSEHSPQHSPLGNIQLDVGEEILRIRTRWWQFWIPKGNPPPPRKSLDDAPVTPIVNASFLSKLTYTWVTPIMALGYQRTLQVSDLWKMDESMSAARLSEQLDNAWARRVNEASEWNLKVELGEVTPGIPRRLYWSVKAFASGNYRERRKDLGKRWREVDGKREASLAWALNEVFGHLFWIGGFIKVFGDTSQMMGPLLVKAIINFAKDRANARDEGGEIPSIGRGIAMAIGLFFIVVCASITNHQFFWRSMTTGVLARAALTNCIYKRGLLLTGKSRVDLPNAKLVNSISTDISRIDTASQWFVEAVLIHSTSCSSDLIRMDRPDTSFRLSCDSSGRGTLGPSALAGFALFLLAAPIQGQIMSHRLKIRKICNVFTDRRAKLLAEVFGNSARIKCLQGIDTVAGTMRIVKYFSYEPPFIQRIAQARAQEMVGVKKMNNIQSANTAFAYSVPVLAATLAFVTYTQLSAQFDVAVVFASLSLFQLLRQPMMFFPRAMSATVDAQNALARLSKIFHADVMSQTPFIVDPEQTLALETKNLTLSWELPLNEDAVAEQKRGKLGKLDDFSATLDDLPKLEPFRVHNIDLEIPRRSITAIVGKCGSGKSSLLQGLIGEMKIISGSSSFGGKIAYCSQISWILNTTLRNNILFGEPFEEERYWKVIEMACLIPDLEIMADGDLTEIGEKGINLSGGQKQRVSIARALYSKAEILLFDDPLSAVDAHVGNALFHGAISSLVREGRTVILVTHAMHFLPYCDTVYNMEAGVISRISKEQLHSAPDHPVSEDRPAVKPSRSNSNGKLNKSNSNKKAAGEGTARGKLIKLEKRTTGSVPWTVYWSYLRAGRGFITIPLIVLTIIFMQGSQIVNAYTLVWWQANTFLKPFLFYQVLYACLGISQAVFTLFLGLAIDLMSTFVSLNLHRDAVENIIYAQMAFFDTTPMGRIQSLLGKDIDTIDNQIPSKFALIKIVIGILISSTTRSLCAALLSSVILTMANVLGAVVIISILEPYFLAAVVFIAFGYNYFGSFYKASSRELKRLDAMLRSLLYAHISESLSGLPTIRSYGKISRFIQDNQYYIDLENRALFLTVTNQRWLAIRVDTLGAFLVFFVSLFAVVGVSGINAAQVGLVLTYSTTLTQLCGNVTRQSAEIENYMNAVERAVYYAQSDTIPQEPPQEIPENKPAAAWPENGTISFKNVSMSYRSGMPNVLRNLSFDVGRNEKIGIVGRTGTISIEFLENAQTDHCGGLRTGAGKSSLILTLLRTVDFEGEITIDGINISKIGLRDLRTKISMIPQEPILFSGTIRSNLDPFSQYDDAILWNALRRSYLVDSTTSETSSAEYLSDGELSDEKANAQIITLDTVLAPEAENLSVGQRALLSIARALVKNSKVVIFDEATASVDYETDGNIQKTIAHEFKDKTILCIAHRLRTIISYDRICVLDAGQISEFDTPANLYRNPSGIFRSMCEQSSITLDDVVLAAKVRNEDEMGEMAYNPRSLILVTTSSEEKLGKPRRALVFRAGLSDAQAVVEFLPRDQVDLSNVVRITQRNVKGCLGMISVDNDLFLAVVTSANEIGNTRLSNSTPESAARIHEVAFFSLTSPLWDDIDAPSSNSEVHDRENFNNQVYEHPCAPLTKIMSSGSFYYAVDSQWDLSSRLPRRMARDPRDLNDIGAYDDRFIWNEYVARSLLDFRERLDPHEREEFDRCQFMILAIQGYVGVFTMALPAPPTNGIPTIATLSLISRLGWKRAGTRFNIRGVDDDGNCANFVETETIFSTDQHCVSYVQVRGSVPLFWEQQGLQTFGQRIQITRPHASQPAFDRHFAHLTEEYGPTHAINLLGTKENEAILSSAYDRHLHIAREALGDGLSITHFDFHSQVRIGGHDSVVRELRRTEAISDHVDSFGFTMCDTGSNNLITNQRGVFRTNCLDCLDRTNFVQDILSRTTLEQYLMLVRREWVQSNTLWLHHRELWAENGDALSKIYAGTGALNTSYTRSGKRTLAGVFSDATKSVSRAYINNFQDKGKQSAIDLFLGNMNSQRPVTIFDPIHDSVRAALDKRLPEYSHTKRGVIFVGTWNLNGRPPSESLIPWLFPRESFEDPDIFVLGFQEIVPLTAQQIVQADPEKKRLWENKILETLDSRPKKKSDYILLRSEQLVGTALLVLVKSELTGVIRNVEATTRKTGLRGMSGNKGAVGIRLQYHDTTFCFVTAHLAAGHANTEERNADYRTIETGLHFLKGKTILSHENIVWLADTNYRIDLENEAVRSLAEASSFDALLTADQLKQAMDAGMAFSGYEEGPLLFKPTYRYDLGTDNYDTSEKMRIPAWTDRVLYRGYQLNLSAYSRAELKGSDHKPVFAIFRPNIRIIDTIKRAALSRLLLNSVLHTAPGEKLDDKLASMVLPENFQSDELPPPSSDEHLWWDAPDLPNGIIPISSINLSSYHHSKNPFDDESPIDTPLSSSPSSSDEELYSAAVMTPDPPPAIARKPPPPLHSFS